MNAGDESLFAFASSFIDRFAVMFHLVRLVSCLFAVAISSDRAWLISSFSAGSMASMQGYVLLKSAVHLPIVLLCFWVVSIRSPRLMLPTEIRVAVSFFAVSAFVGFNEAV